MNYKLKIQRLQQRLCGRPWIDRITLAFIRRLREHEEQHMRRTNRFCQWFIYGIDHSRPVARVMKREEAK